MLLDNDKGLASSLLAIITVLFFFGFVSVIVIPIGSEWSSAIQNLDESVADNYTKQQIADNTGQLLWLDKLFVVFLITMLIAYLITSFTLPAKNAWIFLLFLFFLVVVTGVAMVLSNSWSYMLTDPFFSTVSESIPVTDFVMRNFPYFVFLVGIVGGVVFYSRSREDNPDVGFSGGGGDLPPGVGGQDF